MVLSESCALVIDVDIGGEVEVCLVVDGVFATHGTVEAPLYHVFVGCFKFLASVSCAALLGILSLVAPEEVAVLGHPLATLLGLLHIADRHFLASGVQRLQVVLVAFVEVVGIQLVVVGGAVVAFHVLKGWGEEEEGAAFIADVRTPVEDHTCVGGDDITHLHAHESGHITFESVHEIDVDAFAGTGFLGVSAELLRLIEALGHDEGHDVAVGAPVVLAVYHPVLGRCGDAGGEELPPSVAVGIVLVGVCVAVDASDGAAVALGIGTVVELGFMRLEGAAEDLGLVGAYIVLVVCSGIEETGGHRAGHGLTVGVGHAEGLLVALNLLVGVHIHILQGIGGSVHQEGSLIDVLEGCSLRDNHVRDLDALLEGVALDLYQ